MIGNEKGQPIGGITRIFASASAQFAAAGIATAAATGESVHAAVASSAGVAADDFRFEIVASASGVTTGNMFGAGVIIPQGAGLSEGTSTAVGIAASPSITDTYYFMQKPVDYVLAKEAAMKRVSPGAFTKQSLKGIFRE